MLAAPRRLAKKDSLRIRAATLRRARLALASGACVAILACAKYGTADPDAYLANGVANEPSPQSGNQQTTGSTDARAERLSALSPAAPAFRDSVRGAPCG